MRWHEDKWFGSMSRDELHKFVADNKEHFPLIYDMCEKNAYFEKFSACMFIRIYKNQELDHPTGIVIYDTLEKEKYHIYALEVYDQERLKGNGRYLLKSFLEKADIISLSCLPETKVFYEKLGFKEREELEMVWKRGQNV